MCGKLIYRLFGEVDPLTLPRTRSKRKGRWAVGINPRLSGPLLPSKSPSLLIRLEKVRKRGIIETKGILWNRRIPPYRLPKSTRLRSEAGREGTRKAWVRSCVSTTTRRETLQTGVRSRQKTSIGLSNLHVNDCC